MFTTVTFLRVEKEGEFSYLGNPFSAHVATKAFIPEVQIYVDLNIVPVPVLFPINKFYPYDFIFKPINFNKILKLYFN